MDCSETDFIFSLWSCGDPSLLPLEAHTISNTHIVSVEITMQISKRPAKEFDLCCPFKVVVPASVLRLCMAESTDLIPSEYILKSGVTTSWSDQLRGWNFFSSYSWISEFRCLSAGNRTGIKMHFECDIHLGFRSQTFILSYLCS